LSIPVFQIKNQYTDVFYHTNKHECDFIVIEKKSVTSVVQVTWELHDNNREREIKGVLEAMDVFNLDKGMIITFDQEDILQRENKTIYIKPVWKWLLEQQSN